MCITLFSLLLAGALAFHGFEMVRVTQKLGYEAIQFDGVLTIIPHSNNVMIWNCNRTPFPVFQFNLLEQGVVIPL